MELPNTPEAIASRKALREICDRYKTELKAAGFIGLIMVADGIHGESPDGRGQGILQMATAKTMTARFTIFQDEGKPGQMATKEAYSDYEIITTITLLKSMVELLKQELEAHEGLLGSVSLLEAIGDIDNIN